MERETSPLGFRPVAKEGESLFLPKYPWEPFYVLSDLWNILMDWDRLVRKSGVMSGAEEMEWASVSYNLGQLCSNLSKQSQLWGLNTDPIYDFLKFDGTGKTLPQMKLALENFINFLHRFDDTAEVQWLLFQQTIPKIPGSLNVGANARQRDISDHCLDKDEVRILKALSKRRTPMVQVEIATHVKLDEKTVRDRLKNLRALGFVHWPKGKRRGETITESGNTALARIAGGKSSV